MGEHRKEIALKTLSWDSIIISAVIAAIVSVLMIVCCLCKSPKPTRRDSLPDLENGLGHVTPPKTFGKFLNEIDQRNELAKQLAEFQRFKQKYPIQTSLRKVRSKST